MKRPKDMTREELEAIPGLRTSTSLSMEIRDGKQHIVKSPPEKTSLQPVQADDIAWFFDQYGSCWALEEIRPGEWRKLPGPW